MSRERQEDQGTPVYVWRSSEPPTERVGSLCQYCQFKCEISLIATPDEIRDDPEFRDFFEMYYDSNCDDSIGDQAEHAAQMVCQRCGWWLKAVRHRHGAYVLRHSAAALREFDIASPELAIVELRSHLARNFRDVHALPPRKFEELVGEVYRDLGYEVTLTAESRDGGFDLYCLDRSDNKACIVEVKRYAEKRRVGIALVDRLLGAQIRVGAEEAHLVTSSQFTEPGRDGAKAAERHGVNLKLVDGHALLQHLRAFANPDLTPNDLRAIFAATWRPKRQ